MKLPILWLKKYIDVEISPEKLADALTMSGTAVERVETKDGQTVLHLEITTNRPDCLSLLGLAQEVHALTERIVKVPSEYLLKKINLVRKSPDFDVLLEDKKGCPFYSGVLIENVTVGEAPADIRKCIEAAGARPINNAVDATNFVLFESGQPLHAFDFDKLEGGKIVVRRAKKGEKMTGIDGNEYALDEKTLVIADAVKPVAIAGVIGGKATEVTAATNRILLESAAFDPRLVRESARKYKIATDSAYRFERGVNPDLILKASARAVSLIGEWSKARAKGPTVAVGTLPAVPLKTIRLRPSRVERLLGLAIPSTKITSLLKKLAFDVKLAGADTLFVTPTAARRDITQEADLIEEILRLDGFDKIPVSVPVTRHLSVSKENSGSGVDSRALRVFDLKKYLAAVGFQEILTYSLLSEKVLKDSGFSDGAAHRVTNAVSQEQAFFRPSLLPGMLGALKFNLHRKASTLKFFEIGARVVNSKEETVLALAVTGFAEENWKRKSEAAFYDVKGAVDAVLVLLGQSGISWKEDASLPGLDESARAEVFSGKEGLGAAGRITDAVLARWDIPKPVFFAEIVLESVFEKNTGVFRLKPVPKFPSVRRDIALVVPESVTVAELERVMREAAAPHLREVFFFDEYSGKNIGAGRRSLAFSLAYQKDDGTYTEDEITALQTRVGEALKRAHQVEFR